MTIGQSLGRGLMMLGRGVEGAGGRLTKLMIDLHWLNIIRLLFSCIEPPPVLVSHREWQDVAG